MTREQYAHEAGKRWANNLTIGYSYMGPKEHAYHFVTPSYVVNFVLGALEVFDRKTKRPIVENGIIIGFEGG